MRDQDRSRGFGIYVFVMTVLEWGRGFIGFVWEVESVWNIEAGEGVVTRAAVQGALSQPSVRARIWASAGI